MGREPDRYGLPPFTLVIGDYLEKHGHRSSWPLGGSGAGAFLADLRYAPPAAASSLA
jgi:hypothetical protein